VLAVSDPIGPPAAHRPEEALELVGTALSDGDLEAALAQYERGAVLRPFAMDPTAAAPAMPLHGLLTGVMAVRLPLSVTVCAVLPCGELALVLAERRMSGRGPGGQRVQLGGLGATVVRQQPGGSWRIVADAWSLGGPGLAG
jgi:ketosteroid isomerase-like protein